MGGSSLCPEVLSLVYGSKSGYPALDVLDSTDPAEVRAVEERGDLARTLFIVASKSGSTLEPSIFEKYFFERVSKSVGAAHAGAQFVAITDPGSKLEDTARKKGYRRIFHGVPEIGGRFSALSNFGAVPAASIGLDLEEFLGRADAMARTCDPAVPTEHNPGVVLGTILGLAAESGRDKLTLVISPAIESLGAWLEQLVAESTGKQKKGIIPVDREPLGPPEIYGTDRLFVYVRLGDGDPFQDLAVGELERAGHPVVRIALSDPIELGAEFFRWELATAVAGAILGIHPFDQPDVEASKIVTRELMAAVEEAGALPAEKPFFETRGVQLYADPRNAALLERAAGRDARLSSILGAHLAQAHGGDYFAILAFVQRSLVHERALQELRLRVRDALRVATCLGFGPRYLHSTGQAYKGGPNEGVFLQITCADPRDLPVPGQKYTFGSVEAAQARGDFQVLAERGRRALRVHLTEPVETGLARLAQAVNKALESWAHTPS
jgi:transaldolase/glucose-6-phosphate isomerase